MLVDNMVQYDEYKMPKDTNFLDNQDQSENFENRDNGDNE